MKPRGFVVALLLGAAARFTWAAACCGGNNLVPSLISGDQRTQVTATTAYSRVLGEVPIEGATQWRDEADVESRSSMRLDAATLLSDRWQVGLSLPVVRRFRERNGVQAQAMGVGDVAVHLGYEVLPQWTYSPWKPKGWLFASLTAPTGVAPENSTALYQIDSLGRGYWNVALGGMLLKTWADWDVLFLAQVNQSFAKILTSDAGDFILRPGLGGSAALGIGWSRDALRIGVNGSVLYEGAVATQGLVDEVGTRQISFPLSLQVSYLISDAWSLGALYSDNGWFGPQNVTLNQSISLVVQTRWDR